MPSAAGDHSRATAGAVAIDRTRQSSWESTLRRFYFLLVLPSVILLTIITLAPLLFLGGTSLTPWDLTKPETLRFTGLDNYAELIHDDRFWHSIGIQVHLSVASVGLQVGLGLLIALLLNTKLRLVELLRTVFVIPMVLPPVVVAIVWKILFTPDISVLNYFLGLLNLPQPAWIGDPNLALWSIIIADTWEWFPFSMLMLLAALQMMPEEPLEAARIDGANYLQCLRFITLPLLKPALLVVIIFRIVESVKAFPLIFIMTMGGPGNATEPTNFYAYLQSFHYSYIGYGSTISVVMIVFVILITVLIIRATGRGVDVE